MKIGQNSTRNPMVPSDLAYHAWFKSCASFFENVSKACSKLNTSNLSLVLNLTQIEDVVEVRFELGKKFVREKCIFFGNSN